MSDGRSDCMLRLDLCPDCRLLMNDAVVCVDVNTCIRLSSLPRRVRVWPMQNFRKAIELVQLRLETVRTRVLEVRKVRIRK